MAKHPARRYKPSDIDEAARKYADTQDPMYLVLAIGALPHKPPLWALEECARLVDETSRNAQRGNNPQRTGRLLDEMCRFFICTPENYRKVANKRFVSDAAPPVSEAVRYALRAVVGLTKDDASYASAARVLQREWDEEVEFAEIPPGFEDTEVFEGMPYTRRLVSILMEWGDEQIGHEYRHVSLHLLRHDRSQE